MALGAEIEEGCLQSPVGLALEGLIKARIDSGLLAIEDVESRQQVVRIHPFVQVDRLIMPTAMRVYFVSILPVIFGAEAPATPACDPRAASFATTRTTFG